MTRTKREAYDEAYAEAGNFAEVARRFNVSESTVRKELRLYWARLEADPSIKQGMKALNMEDLPDGGWVKSQKPDEFGRTYSFRFSTVKKTDDELMEEAERRAEVFRNVPAVILPKPKLQPVEQGLRGFIPLNDLHAGAYAWGAETGYGDWDLGKAVDRLTNWVGELVSDMQVVDECILYYNGDTLHANDSSAETPASKHRLDVDTRHFRTIDAITAAIIATVDMAAQKHRTVRVVIKQGNHDRDSYVGLLMGVKWRYYKEPRVIVETDPSPYWSYNFGKVFLFGHHGDRIKPEQLVLKMASDNREVWGQTKYSYVWTAHLHNRRVEQLYGTIIERASCLTNPDAHGAKWGENAQAMAIIYHPERGERKRFTVRL